jgi:TRAP transporter 4TM/12TM fusion protein
VLYYFGVWAGVHFEAKKLGLRGLSKEELPNLKEIFINRGYLMLPLIGIIWLLVTGYTPMLAAFYAIILSIAAALLGWWAPFPIGAMVIVFSVMRPVFGVGGTGVYGPVKYITQMTPLGALVVLGIIMLCFYLLKKKPNLSTKEIVGGLESGARGAIGVLSATACAGIIIGVVTKTGLGLKLGTVLVGIANGNLLLTLVFTMITSIILGMGVPTTANYIITSTIAAPAIIMILRELNPELAWNAISIVLPAHMFAFYFGIIADVTPPVALAAFAASGIAKSNPMKTGLQASRLAIAAFLVPYIFVMNPQMLLIDVQWVSGILMIITALIGIIGVASALMGYLVYHAKTWERFMLFIGGVLLVNPGIVTDLIGIALVGVAVIIQLLRKKASK